ncbi:hypothetical protein ICHIJ1_14450 [Fluviibacter phosphoraccumulans]|uniref:ESPR-type extended signal peptide-containing protein n=1 Tax=Fluviibacter phosphoraccumulans TaxID=1751046 RepID=UPI0013676429|nr:ESPR-type extended signal peptide-containing protein [Fluviibacter phosphoraccumulans]BBU71526.1 hypothetical protein ICHIJ1_14450 [Fluviibacter phosphoraccumulans]
MNKSYRIVWNKVRNCVMVVSETTKSHGKAGKTGAVVTTIAAAVMALGAASQTAQATDYVVPGGPVPSGYVYGSQLTMGTGDTLTVANNGSISANAINEAGVNLLQVTAGVLPSGISILNEGSIYGSLHGISVANSTVAGYISNSGTITGGLGVALYFNDSSIGGIVNAGYAGSGAYAINLGVNNYISGGINNLAGATLYASGPAGINVGSRNTIDGGITNSGNIIADQGIVIGSTFGLLPVLINGDIVSNANATIVAPNGAINVANATIVGSIINAGVIAGPGIALNSVSLSGGIYNSITGFINGTSLGLIAILMSQSTVNGGVDNAGLIGANAGGISILQSSLGGGINNREGASIVGLAAINIGPFGNVSGGLTNSGFIGSTLGGGYAVQVDGTGSLDRIVIAGNNTASFSGDVWAAATPVTVAGGATYTLNSNFTVSGFTNQGTIIVPTASTVAPQIVGDLTLVNGSTFSPTVLSQSDYTRMTVTGGINLAGSLFVNAATISGALTIGSTLSGIISGPTTAVVSGTFSSYDDNSALYNLIPIYGSSTVGLVVAQGSVCSGILAANQTGPCEVAYDAPQLLNVGYTISGGLVGINVLAGNITNSGSGVGITNTGLISGINNAVEFQTGATLQGTILNSGVIAATSGSGVLIVSSTLNGAINNQVGGAITGLSSAIYLNNATLIDGIDNSGLIQGSAIGSIGLQASVSTINGGISNSSSGTITGDFFGIRLINSSLSDGVTNAGLIRSSNVSPQTVSRAGLGIESSSVDGSIINTGSLYGYYGVNLQQSTVHGDITNSGYISGYSSAVRIKSNSLIVGSITNMAGGSISSLLGMDIGASVAGYINNAGLISGSLWGVNLDGAQIAGVDNSAVIQSSGGMDAMRIVGGSVIDHGITNSGLIQTSGQVAVNINGSTVNGGIQNLSGATVTAAAAGFSIDNSWVNGGFTNSGLVSGARALQVINGSTVFGSVLNNTGATISGLLLSASAINGGVTNTGIISRSSGNVAMIQGFATVSSGFLNAGTISGSDNALTLGNGLVAGGVVNTGLISTSGSVVSKALQSTNFSTVQGGLNNAGTVFGNQAVYLQGLVQGGVTNTGAIIATTGSALTLSSGRVQDGFNNTGSIASQGAWSVYLSYSSIGGGFTNSGLIQSNIQRGLVLNRSTVTGGFSNIGTISGALSGIKVTGGNIIGGLTNSGLIRGNNGTAINVDGSALIERIVIAGNNTASFGGRVSAANISTTVVGGATYTMNSNFEVSNFANEGILIVPVASTVLPTITGNLTLVSGGTFSPTIQSQTSYTKVTVSGNANIGGHIYVNAATLSGALVAGSTLNGVISASSVSGSFASFNDNSALYDLIPVYSATQLGLAVVAVSGCSGVLTANAVGPCQIAYDAPYVMTAGYTVSGGNVGIEILSGNITNSGTGVGVTNTGLISGSLYGIQALTGSIFEGAIVNEGSLAGGGTGILMQGAVVAGGLTNTGSITGGVGAGVSLAGSVLLGGLNNLGGSITGGNTGLQMVASTIAGGISNSGYIQGQSATGIALVSSEISGNLHNAGGTIAGVQNGLSLSGSVITAGLTNAGLITGSSASGIALTNATTVIGGLNNVTNATISGGVTGLSVAANSVISGGLTNAGLITGGVGAGVSLAGSVLLGGLNNLGGSITGGNTGLQMVASTIAGGISNSGYIQGQSATGIALVSSEISGNLHNAGGTIAGVQNGLSLSGSVITAGLTNAGLITGSSASGIALTNATTVIGGLNNVTNATISGGVTGLSVAANSVISGGLTNAGLITGGVGAGVSLAGSVLLGGLNNLGGSITGGNTGLQMVASTIAGGISNSGYIQGQSATGIALVSSEISGNLHNAGGTIAGVQNGLSLSGSVITAGLTNAGLITGSSASGIALTNATTVIGGLNNVTNATISGGVTGLSVAANSVISGGLTNAGLITGGTYAINAPGLTSILATGTDSRFVGTVSAVNALLAVASGSTMTAAQGVTVSSISVNAGSTLNLVTSPTSNTSGGVSVSNGFTNSGIVNVGLAAATVTGDYVQNPSGALRISALNTSNYGSLNVTGLASFSPNAMIQMVSVTGSTFANGSILAGVINAGTLSATSFAVSSNSALLFYRAQITGNSVNVIANRNNENGIQAAVSTQGNVAGYGAATALDKVFSSFVSGGSAFASMNPAMAAFANMNSNDQISQAVSQSLPVLSSNSPIQTLAVLTAINQSIEARSLKLRGVSSGHEMYGNNTVWMKPFGSWMNQGNMNGAYGFKANAGGLIIGADHQWDDKARFGGAFAWGNSSANSNMGGQNQTSNMYQFVGYGAYAVTPSVNVNFQANGGWNNNTTNRNIGFLGTSAQASYDSAVWHAGVGVDRPTKLSEDTTFIPQARFDYTWIRNQGYSETGAAYGMGLNVGSQTYQTSVLGVDGKVQHKIGDHHMVSTNLGVGYNFSPTQTWVAASYQGASALQFTTTGVNPSAVSGKAGLGYTYKVKEGVDVGVRYDIDVQEQYTNQIATAKARWNF